VLIRRWRVEDAEPLSRAVAESLEHLRPWMPWIAGEEAMTLELRRTWVEEREREWQQGGDVLVGMFVDGAVAGGCGLHRRLGPRALEIGYWTHASLTRRGIATATARALTDAALGLPGIDAVEIHHDRANVASAGVPRRLGFHFLGATPHEPEAPGEEGVRWAWRMDRRAWSDARRATN
jgi:RimJ/RimL family protein N-acetyltransferase